MIRHMRHGSSPRLMTPQPIRGPNRREALATPSAGDRIITHVSGSGAQALMVVRMVPKTVVPDVRRAVSTTVRTAASPSRRPHGPVAVGHLALNDGRSQGRSQALFVTSTRPG